MAMQDAGFVTESALTALESKVRLSTATRTLAPNHLNSQTRQPRP